MLTSFALLVVAAAVLSFACGVHCLGDRPIIGILTEPMSEPSYTQSFVTASYVKFVESAGARAAVVPFDAPLSQLKTLFNGINGILFAGGDLNLAPGERYFDTAWHLWNWANEANARGDHFPLWGTCQGFQLLNILAANSTSVLLDGFDSENLSLALSLTPTANQSGIISSAPASVIHTLASTNSTMNLHHMGVPPPMYTQYPSLGRTFNMISTNVDRKDRAFVSMMQGKTLPYFGVQYHPERNAFEYYPDNIDKSLSAIRAMAYLANHLVGEARKSRHFFANPVDEQSALIYNYADYLQFTDDPTNSDFSDFQMYIWSDPGTKRARAVSRKTL